MENIIVLFNRRHSKIGHTELKAHYNKKWYFEMFDSSINEDEMKRIFIKKILNDPSNN